MQDNLNKLYRKENTFLNKSTQIIRKRKQYSTLYNDEITLIDLTAEEEGTEVVKRFKVDRSKRAKHKLNWLKTYKLNIMSGKVRKVSNVNNSTPKNVELRGKFLNSCISRNKEIDTSAEREFNSLLKLISLVKPKQKHELDNWSSILVWMISQQDDLPCLINNVNIDKQTTVGESNVLLSHDNS